MIIHYPLLTHLPTSFMIIEVAVLGKSTSTMDIPGCLDDLGDDPTGIQTMSRIQAAPGSELFTVLGLGGSGGSGGRCSLRRASATRFSEWVFSSYENRGLENASGPIDVHSLGILNYTIWAAVKINCWFLVRKYWLSFFLGPYRFTVFYSNQH